MNRINQTEILPAGTRQREEYYEGMDAYHGGASMAECPYNKEAKLSWLSGFLDCRTFARLHHIFDKYRLAWP